MQIGHPFTAEPQRKTRVPESSRVSLLIAPIRGRSREAWESAPRELRIKNEGRPLKGRGRLSALIKLTGGGKFKT